MLIFFVFGLSVHCLKLVPSAAVAWLVTQFAWPIKIVTKGTRPLELYYPCGSFVYQILSLRLQLFERIKWVREILAVQFSPQFSAIWQPNETEARVRNQRHLISSSYLARLSLQPWVFRRLGWRPSLMLINWPVLCWLFVQKGQFSLALVLY